MPAQHSFDTDVLIIGGGPAGSTAATLLARRGWRVQVIEKEQHPRFHIGESLLPMNLPILERLGVAEQVAAIGVKKLAADFPTQGGHYTGFAFARALGAKRDHAWQVRRDQFDQLLFANAAEAGARCVEACEVRAVEPDPAGGHRVELRDGNGEFTLRTRYVIDASGRDTVLGRKLNLKHAHPRHRSAAIYGHFRGVERRPGEAAGNISIYRLARGWVWMIPLPDGVMSVGAVCDPDYLKTRRGPLDAFLLDTVRANPDARARMQDATSTGLIEATGNYSYTSREIAGPGWLLVGDAYAFVDPIFSSGVFLAMHGAELAADVVDAALRTPSREAAAQRAYRKRLDRGITVFSWFIERFTSPAMAQLFQAPRNVLQVEQAVISMLAGDVFDNRPALRRLRLFRLLFRITALTLGRRRESAPATHPSAQPA